MKLNHFIYTIFACGLLAVSCSQEDGVLNDSLQPIRINVSDTGMKSGNPGSRANTTGLVTTFDNGDEIGLYAVNNGEIVKNNIKLTKTATGWDGLSSGADLTEGTEFYAYYPYADDASFTVSNAFSTLIKNWNPTTKTSYTLGDLMTTSEAATLDHSDGYNYSLNLNLSHAMSMIEVTVNGGATITYEFENEGMANYVVAGGDSEPTFTLGGTAFTSVAKVSGNYRILVNPATEDNLTIAVGAKTYAPTNALNVTGGKYYTMTVGSGEGGGSQTITHNLQVGDYYCADGTLIAKGTSLSAEQKNNVLGVVYYVGSTFPTELYPKSYGSRESSDDAFKTACPGCTHGLVYAFDEAIMSEGSSAWGTVAFPNLSTLFTDYSGGGYGVIAERSNSNVPKRVFGYDNMATLRLINQTDNYFGAMFAALNALKDAPNVSSGWFLPSYGDLALIANGTIQDGNKVALTSDTEAISAAFTEVSKSLWESGIVYMTSTPGFKESNTTKMYGYSDGGFPVYTVSDQAHTLRPALAF